MAAVILVVVKAMVMLVVGTNSPAVKIRISTS